MDLTKKYIQMCRKALDIQSSFSVSVGDYCVRKIKYSE